jgi:hypothetical protein
MPVYPLPYHVATAALIRWASAHRWTIADADPTDYTPADGPTDEDRAWAAANLNDDSPAPALWLAWEREQELAGAIEAELGMC